MSVLREALCCELASCCTHRTHAVRIVNEIAHGLTESHRVAGRHQDRRFGTRQSLTETGLV